MQDSWALAVVKTGQLELRWEMVRSVTSDRGKLQLGQRGTTVHSGPRQWL